MQQHRGLSAASHLQGLAVMAREASGKLGVVADLLAHPTEGYALGLILRTEGDAERTVGWQDCAIGNAAVVLNADARLRVEVAEGVKVCGELLGAHVVTEAGALLGRVREVYVHAATGHVVYHVVASKWQQLIGGGGYLAGDLPYSYSRLGRRLLVPAGAELMHVAPAPHELAAPRRQQIAWAEERG